MSHAYYVVVKCKSQHTLWLYYMRHAYYVVVKCKSQHTLWLYYMSHAYYVAVEAVKLRIKPLLINKPL